MNFDYLHLYVKDYSQACRWYQESWGFALTREHKTPHSQTGVFQQGQILLLISAPLGQQGASADYLSLHPPGIGEVAFQVAHWSAFNEKLAVLGIATTPIVHPLTEAMGLTFTAWGNVRHSLFPRRQPLDNKAGLGLMAIDHVVLNVPKADFQAASSWYQTLFKWRVQQRFTITTPYSGLYSEALIDHGEQIQFNLNCPSNQHSQIQTFLNHNHGAGIQHVAFRSHSILETIKRLRQNSVAFLSVPRHYYVRKQQQFTATPRPDHSPHIDWQTLQDLGILVDGEKTYQSSLLLQIFTQPLFGQSSFFWEIIERCQRATGFGEGNFQALYEAVEAGENSH